MLTFSSSLPESFVSLNFELLSHSTKYAAHALLTLQRGRSRQERVGGEEWRECGKKGERERERSVWQLQAFNNQLWPNKASKLRLQTQQPQLGNVFNMQLHLPLPLPLPLPLHLQLRLPLLMYANKLSKVISFNYLIYRMREKQKPKPKPKEREREILSWPKPNS